MDPPGRGEMEDSALVEPCPHPPPQTSTVAGSGLCERFPWGEEDG